MKKSKLLMPLTGIAAIGAFAPVVAMTACHNTNDFIASVKCGTIVDGHTKLMTNKLGIESLTADGKTLVEGAYAHLDFAVTIKDDFKALEGDKVSVAIPATGTIGAAGTPFYIDAEVKTTIVDLTSVDKIFYREWDEDDGFLKINKAVMDKLIEDKATKEFSFNAIYTITHKDETTTTQTVTYTVEACPALHDVCVILNQISAPGKWDFVGAQTGTSQKVSIQDSQASSWWATTQFFDVAPIENLKIVATSDSKWVSEDKNTLTIAKKDLTATAGRTYINEDFDGTLNEAITEDTTFELGEDETGYIQFAITVADTAKTEYVLSSWTSTIICSKDFGGNSITVTHTA